MMKILLIVVFIAVARGNSMAGSFSQCSLQCSSNEGTDGPVLTSHRRTNTLLRGKSGPRGAKGDPGVKGESGRSCDVREVEKLRRRISELESDMAKQKNTSQEDISGLKRKLAIVTDQLNETNEQVQVELTSLNETVMDHRRIGPIRRSCKENLDNGLDDNGVYIITVGVSLVTTRCDMDAGGYIVFQRRFDGSTNFRQDYQTYVNGFGDVYAEYWLGLEKLHQLTRTGRWQLRVDLEAYSGDPIKAYAVYDDFRIGGAPGYRLYIGNYSGTAGNSLGHHNLTDFSTPNTDNDRHDSINCAERYQGAWWFNSCHTSHLNAFVYSDRRHAMGMEWYHFKGRSHPMKKTTMMLREM